MGLEGSGWAGIGLGEAEPNRSWMLFSGSWRGAELPVSKGLVHVGDVTWQLQVLCHARRLV